MSYNYLVIKSMQPDLCAISIPVRDCHKPKINIFCFLFLEYLSNALSPVSRPPSVCSMVSALADFAGMAVGSAGSNQDQTAAFCPVCRSHYDSGKQRKLVDTNCGHARCFTCMFAVGKYYFHGKLTHTDCLFLLIETCPLCSGNMRVQMRKNQDNNKQSCMSRESGFQSFNGSVSSIFGGYNGNANGNGSVIEFDRQSSTGSLISLMSGASTSVSGYFNSSRPPGSDFCRNDQKRHSLTSLGRFQPSSASSSIGSRNSFVRRSAIIPRNQRRLMTSIIEHQRKKIPKKLLNQSKL